MKKLRLLFAATAAVFAMNATAQTWTGSDPAEGTYFLYNVGTGKFINVGDKSAGWGTNAYLTADYGLDFIFEAASDGAFNLNSQVSNGGASHYLATGMWCDGAATPWTFTKVNRSDINAYTISNGESLIVANAAGTDVEYVAASGTERDQWQVIGREDILANLVANTANGVNRTVATFFISDPDFGRNDLRMSPNQKVWQYTFSGGNKTIPGRDLNLGGTGNQKNYGCEFWNNTFDIHQDIVDLPSGIYEFEIYGFGTNGTTFIYATTTEGTTEKVFKNQTSAANFATALDNIDNYGGNVTGLVRVTDGKLTIGVKRETNSNYDWTVIDQARLYYYGDYTFAECYGADLKELIATAKKVQAPAACLAQAIENAEKVMQNGTQESEFSEAMALLQAALNYNDALAAANSAKNDPINGNVTGVELTGLNNAIADAPGAALEDIVAKTEALKAATNTFTGAAAPYNAFYTYKAETAALFGDAMANSVAAPTNAAEAQAGLQALNIAQYNKVSSDYTFSCTGLIGDFGSWTGTATVNGQPATPNYLDYEHWSGVTHAYYEQASNGWGSSAWTIKYEKTCKLPAGSYVIKVAARSSAGTSSKVSCTATETAIALPNVGAGARGINKAGEASWTDGEFANNGNGFGWQWRFLPFTLDKETEVTMTFYAEANSQYQWMSIADGELLSATKLAKDIVFDEAKENAVENTLIADVTIKRNIVEGYNTVVLPFQLGANQVTAAFGEGAVVYNYSDSGEKASETTVNFTRGDGSIAANTPVLVKTSKASTEQKFEGVQIVEGEPFIKGNFYSMKGIYSPLKLSVWDYIVNDEGVAERSKAATINGFCAYLKINEGAGQIIKTVIDGQEVTTGINGLYIENSNNGKIYNLNGQEVKNARKGLYIQNGKKVIMK